MTFKTDEPFGEVKKLRAAYFLRSCDTSESSALSRYAFVIHYRGNNATQLVPAISLFPCSLVHQILKYMDITELPLR